MNIPPLRETLRILCTELENTWIEKEVYRNLIEVSSIVTPGDLKNHTEKALSDPELRTQVRQRFSKMWEALDAGAREVEIEDLLNNLPPTGKPN